MICLKQYFLTQEMKLEFLLAGYDGKNNNFRVHQNGIEIHSIRTCFH